MTSIPQEHPASRILLSHNQINAWSGLRPDGRFQLTTHAGNGLSAAQFLPANPVNDDVIVIGKANVRTYLQRGTLVNRLVSMRQEGRVKLHSVKTLVEHIMSVDPVTSHFFSTRKRQFTDPALPSNISPDERELLMQDAALAWRFIERFTNNATGLCAGTVRGGSDMRVNQDITMWDLASQIQGIIAAQKLSLINMSDGQQRIAKLLEHLPKATIDTLSLPPLFFSASTGKPRIRGFDLCDTGRFFTAMSAAYLGDFISLDKAQKVFDLWDINGALKNGHPHNYVDGKWIDTHLSHCTSYTAHGLAALGINVLSPYGETDSSSLESPHISWLYMAASIGHYGTEPMLIEAIELGSSDTSEYLSNVLFDAQLGYFEQTGQIKCASETLLDFAPWFSYQGIRLDRFGEAGWVVATPNPSAKYQTAEFYKKAEVISSKSAYLWAANYPHPHSYRMLDLIRDKARVDDLGFSAGVFANSLTAMQYYSDINTNGIILTAIAHMLHPQQ